MSESYELYALRYANHAPRPASENFLDGDPHETGSPLDYFVWLARNGNRTILIDLGFTPEAAAKRGRTFLRSPLDGLRVLGIDPQAIDTVIVTHFHYDHVGNHAAFPNARFHIQDREMAYATGRHMTHPRLRAAYDPDDVAALVRAAYAERVIFHDGDWQAAPGVGVALIGGHTLGLQIVRVATARGNVVIASDAMHLYANAAQSRPFPIVHDVGAMIEGWRRARELADSDAHVVPGHDPLVMERYTQVDEHIADLAQSPR
jgi:glyoxylase-like metal-dependent hydrolase (beta-lactamase superfamily II)